MDLPIHAHRYECPLDPVTQSSQQYSAPTAYSVLACSMGYTALRAFARALERRAKHIYAVLVLDVCVAILTLRDDSNERRKLQRELCVVSARQSDHNTGSTHCRHVLDDFCERLERQQTHALAYIIENRGVHSRVMSAKCLTMNCAAIQDIHEFLFTTELLVIQYANAGDILHVHAALRNLIVALLQRRRLCATEVASHELGLVLQQATLYAAHISVEQCEPASGATSFQRALAKWSTSHRRRIALLSYLAEASILCGDVTNAQLVLSRIKHLRRHVIGLAGDPPSGTFACVSNKTLWDAPLKGRLVSFCDDNVDLGQLVAEVDLLKGCPRRALKTLASTIAAAEAAVSRIGSVPGLGELGTLYELRGRAQAALAKNAEAINFPLRIDSGEDFDEIIQHPRANYRQLYDETSRRFRSRHYRSYCDAVEVRIDASRWYRHALECFKATDDSFGVARAASAFAALNLNTIFLEIAWDVPPSNLQQRGGCMSIDEVNAAAYHALELTAVALEPLLLLEAYLNVAELRHVHDDSLSAIAHWWEARELLLRLFVNDVFVPLAIIADITVLFQLRSILERLLRFLAAVADTAMIEENIVLFEIFVLFERDARRRCPLRNGANQNYGSHGLCESTLPYVSTSLSCNIVIDALSCWRCIVRTRMDVSRHCLGNLTVNELHDRNRNTLCELAAMMRRLRHRSRASQSPKSSVPTVYVIHAAGSLVIYAPRLGWRHALAFGRSGRGLDASCATFVRAFAGTQRVVTKGNGIEHRRRIIKRISHIISLPRNFFSTLLASENLGHSVVALVCSERAQVLPWECLADIAVSRILCASDVAWYYAQDLLLLSGPNRALPLNKKQCCIFPSNTLHIFCHSTKVSALKESLFMKEVQPVINLLVHELSLPLMIRMDKVKSCLQCPNAIYQVRKVLPYARPSFNYHYCTFDDFISLSKSTPRVLPISMLYVPQDALLQLQAKHTELIFAPNVVIAHVNTRLDAQHGIAKAEHLKALSEDLALPIVHSV